MKKIIVRFPNEKELKIIGDKIGIELSSLTTKVYLDTKEVKNKKRVLKKQNKNNEWKEHWIDMPKYSTDFKDDAYAKIEFLYEDTKENKIKFEEIFEQSITNKTKSIWFPKLIPGKYRQYRVIGGENPKYPVYVVSKGRYENKSWHTSYRLSQISVPHYLVVEPDEYELYKSNFSNEFVTILKMDLKYKDEYDCFSDLGNINSTGPGAARNFCWEHSISNGFDYHWVLDDNIDGFDRYMNGHRVLMRTGEVFRSCERFVERYSNIGISGMNYHKFCVDGSRVPPYTTNTRIYSIILIKNSIPFRWRGRYNEDTDLSLRVLKSGLCTVQFNAFLGEKVTTQVLKGGNTKEFYEKEGTFAKTQMLVDMHPDVTKMVTKFNRIHHEVDYSGFKQKLILKEDIDIKNNDFNENGMKVVFVPEHIRNTINDNKEYITSNCNEVVDLFTY